MLPRLLRPAFFLAALFALFMALDPKPPAMPFDGAGDKFEHMLAFAVLSVLARMSFRQTSSWRIGERLSFFGALIEVFQSIPSLHRDCDPLDWLADTLAIAAALAICYLIGRSGRVPLLSEPASR
jgi:hypothetical protein